MAKLWLGLVTRVQCTAVAVLLRREQRLAEGDKLPAPPPLPLSRSGRATYCLQAYSAAAIRGRILYYPWFK